jgi:RNA polymerase sigma factor (sigma-70 family)
MLEDQLDLWHRFREGDPAALGRVYEDYRGEVRRLAKRGFTLKGARLLRIPGLRDQEALNDTVQEVFTKAFSERARRAYDGQRPYAPYLLQITRNVRIDQERRRWREVLVADWLSPPPEASAKLAFPLITPREQTPEGMLCRERTRLKILLLLASLDPALQRLYALRFVEELSQDQAARQMSVTRRHARTLEKRVFEGVRRHFPEERAA